MKNTKYNHLITLIVPSLRLGYILIHRTPPYITGLEARKQGLAYIYKPVLKHKNNVQKQTFVSHNVSTLDPGIILRLHFYLSLNR